MANSYMVGNAPAGASYAAPLAGFQIGDRLASLPQQYFEGQQRARTLAMQKPILDENGQPTMDPKVVIPELLRRGGGEYAEKLMPFMMGQEIGNQAADQLSGSSGAGPGGPAAPGGPARAPSPPGGTAGPGNISGPRVITQPALSATGTDNNGQDTLRSVATETAAGRDVGAQIPRWAQALGVNPDDPLTPEQVTRARAVVGRTMSAMTGGSTALGSRNPAVIPGGPSESDGGGVAPTPASGASGSPGPAQSGVRSVPAPAAGDASGPGGQPGAPGPGAPIAQPGAGGAQPGWDEATATRLDQAAAHLRSQGARYAAMKMPDVATNFEKQAEALEARSKQIRDVIGEGLKPTGAQKEALSTTGTTNVATLEGAKTTAQDAAKGFTQKGSAIDANAQSARASMPMLQAGMRMLNDPKFVSGPGSDWNLFKNRVLASPWARETLGKLGYSPDQAAASSEEAFNAIMSRQTIDDLKAVPILGGTQGAGNARSAGPILDAINRASAGADNSVWGNRMMLALEMRAKQRLIDLDTMRQNYNNGTIDNGFDKIVTAYDGGKLSPQQMRQYGLSHQGPMLAPDELKDPRLLGAPTFASEAELHAAKLPHGHPFRWANGAVGYMQ